MKHNHMKLFLSPEIFFSPGRWGGPRPWGCPPWIRHWDHTALPATHTFYTRKGRARLGTLHPQRFTKRCCSFYWPRKDGSLSQAMKTCAKHVITLSHVITRRHSRHTSPDKSVITRDSLAFVLHIFRKGCCTNVIHSSWTRALFTRRTTRFSTWLWCTHDALLHSALWYIIWTRSISPHKYVASASKDWWRWINFITICIIRLPPGCSPNCTS